MKFQAVRLRHVGLFGSDGAAIENITDGLNVLAAANETGKSTVLKAVQAALFSKHNSRHQEHVLPLRPYGDGGPPTVELDLEIDGRHYRVLKRFLSRPMAEIRDLENGRQLAAADAAEDWIKETIGSGRKDDGPAGLLWVEQGGSRIQPSGAGSRGELLTSLLDHEVSTMTGGARLRSILSVATCELEKLVTDRQQRPRGDYKLAVDECEALTGQIAELELRAAGVEETLEELQRIDARLCELNDAAHSASFQAQLTTARREVESAANAVERLERLRSELKHAETTFVAATEHRDRLQADQQAALARIAKADALRPLVEAAEATVKALQTRRDETEAVLKAAERTYLDAKHQADLAHRSRKGAEASEQLKVKTTALAKALEKQRSLKELQAEYDGIRITRALMDEIDALTGRRDQLQARMKAGQPTVSILYNKGSDKRVRIAGRELADREAVSVDGRLEIAIDGVGILEVRSGDGTAGADHERAYENANTTCLNALAAAGYETVAGARSALERKAGLAGELRSLRHEIGMLAPKGVAALQSDIVLLKAAAEQSNPEAMAEEDAREAEAAAEKARSEANERFAAAVERYTSANNKLIEDRAQLRSLSEQIMEALDRLGSRQDWEENIKSRRSAVAKAQSDVAKIAESYNVARSNTPDLDAAKAKLQAVEDESQKRYSEVTKNNLTRERLCGSLARDQADGIAERLGQKKEELAAAEARCESFAAEVRALILLIAVLSKSRDEMRERFFDPVSRELDPLLRQVLPDCRVTLDENFSPQELVRGGLAEAIAQLSGGTQEQIAVLTRLAFARLMVRNGKRMPVILDDALVFSDDVRIANMFTALSLAAGDIQLLVLTCRQKSFAGLAGNVLHIEPWMPGSD